ncbi:MAG: hypothetical protein EOP06_25965 [Proteobacteria bacterium]|nr:MAG: hypothetical protein EOP06_25965 [Pseudomonadota bacterium]
MTQRIFIRFPVGIILCLFGTLYGCDIAASDSLTKTEVSRVTSPDKKYDFVSYAVEGGATVANRNELYLTAVGETDREKGTLIMQLRDVNPVEVAWRDKESANIPIGGKKLDNFKNYAYVGNDDGYSHELRFYLK